MTMHIADVFHQDKSIGNTAPGTVAIDEDEKANAKFLMGIFLFWGSDTMLKRPVENPP